MVNIIQAVSSHKNQFLRSFSAFSNIVRKFSNFKYCCFELIFGQEMDSKASSANFFHIRIVHKKFQLKIPTLRKNDCSATRKPNTYKKNFTQDQLRNVQRYQKICSSSLGIFLTVSYQFTPTVYYFTS